MLLLACLFVGIGLATAQVQKVTGLVISEEDGQPVVGASVLVKGTNQGTITGVDGRFVIPNVSSTAKTLIISYIGMQTQEVTIKSNVRVVLKSDAEILDEVVIVGYGSARKVGTTVGSISTVSAKKLESRPSASALDALQGQVAGLQVYTSDGTVGQVQSIRLHGLGSLGASSAPLYVIDGLPSDSRAILAMNPNDIESITVLKDASATSIYGSRAANGVIYVTTKRGAYQNDASITVRGQYGISTLANSNFYENMMSSDQLTNLWLDMGAVSEDWIKANYYDKGYNANTKWYKYFQNLNNPQYQSDIAIQGGGEKVSYYISASQFHEEGSSPGNYFDRYSARSNIDARPKSWLKTGLNLNLSLDKRQSNSNWGTNSTSGGLSYLLSPLYSPYDKDGNKYEDYIPGLNRYNPNYAIDKNPDEYTRYGVIANAFVEIEPIKNLKIRSRFGTDMGITRDDWESKPSYIPNKGIGTVGKSSALDRTSTITNSIEYRFNINDIHQFTVLAAQEGTENYYEYFYGRSQKQTDDRLMHLNNGEQPTYKMSSEDTTSKFLSFFGRLDYSLYERYIFDASIRNDECTRFGRDNRSATFFSFGGMWKMKKEAFLEDVKWLSNLDLKVSYGTQGNAAIGDYASMDLVGAVTDYDTAPSWGTTQPGNSKLSWETQSKLTIGVNTRLFDRLNFGIEYYVRKTSDMLMDVPYPYTSGFDEITRNVGSLENSGIDINASFDVLSAKDYYLTINANFNYNKQKITKLFDGKQRWDIANTGVTYVVGDAVSFYYPIYAGVNPANGAQQWYLPGDNVDVTTKDPTRITENFNEDALIQNSGKKRYAPIAGGFSLTGGWKGLSLQADFSYVLGKYLINNDEFFYANPYQFFTYNGHKDILDYWKKEGDVTKYPAWGNGEVMHFDTHLLQNASFLRLKNLQIAYQLPKKWFANSNSLKGAKITLTGRNLFTVTKYNGIDPEVDSNLTLGRVGNSKQYMVGLELNF